MLHPGLSTYVVERFHNDSHLKHYNDLLHRLGQVETVTYQVSDIDCIYQLSGLYAQRDTLVKSVTDFPLIVNTNSRGGSTTAANPNANVLDRVETNIRHLLKELLLTQLTRHKRIGDKDPVNELDELFGNV